MFKKYSVEYNLHFRRHSPPDHHYFNTDDPVACEEFVQDLLEKGMGIHAIKHEGIDLPKAEFDRMIKLAAAALASKCLCASLDIKPEEVHYRFGFAG